MKKLIFLLVLSLFVTGCQFSPLALVAPIVTGVIMWSNGEATKYYDGDVETICRCTRLSLREMNLPISRDEATKNGYYIVAGKDSQFKIKVESIQPNIAKVSMRINFMGDKPLAELVYKHIDQNLDVIEFNQGRPIKNK